jgi:hypothetical protein
LVTACLAMTLIVWKFQLAAGEFLLPKIAPRKCQNSRVIGSLREPLSIAFHYSDLRVSNSSFGMIQICDELV